MFKNNEIEKYQKYKIHTFQFIAKIQNISHFYFTLTKMKRIKS